MFRSNLKIAWRNLLSGKVISLINILGLSTGFTCCMLISVYIVHELSYDSYQPRANQLYQVGTTIITQGKQERKPVTPAPMGEAMKREFPEVQECARLFVFNFFGENKNLFQYSAPDGSLRSYYEANGVLADPSFFNLFSYQFVEGDPLTALSGSNSVVISEEIAKKIFGEAPAIHKIIHISSYFNRDQQCMVTGVFKPSDHPSHIDARFFISIRGGDMEQSMKGNETNMINNSFYFTYLLLRPGTDSKKLESKFPSFIEKYAGRELRAAGFSKTQFLIPVKDIHLHSGMPADITVSGNATALYVLVCIAIFILLIACINFMNLATARSSTRSSEIGVRKVLGALRKSLILQFLGESVMMTSIAFIIAILFCLLLLPAFADLSARSLSLGFSELVILSAIFFVLSLITGIMGGIYPAIYLSSFEPVRVFKGNLSNTLGAIFIRKGLVIFQFLVSVVLIISAIIISRQMHFLRSSYLGFAKDQQIVIPILSDQAIKIYTPLKKEISNKPQVLAVAGCFYYPGIFFNSMNNLLRRAGQLENLEVKMNWVDDNYLQTLEIMPLAGRLFSPSFPSDSLHHVILNEEAIKKLGFSSPKEAIGQMLIQQVRGQSIPNQIIGVVKNFHFQDFHRPIAPFAFYLNNTNNFSYIIVHAGSSQLGRLLQSIENSWNSLDPGEPFTYSFLDDDFQKNYASDNRLSSIVSSATGLAILISCMGLFGLAAFSVEQRTKEIGIRKVLGASAREIVGLLTKDFLRLVALSTVLACPIAYSIMQHWLQDFAYRVSITWIIFVLASLIALSISFITIGLLSLKAATANPIRAIRSQ